MYKHGLALAACCSEAPGAVIDSFARYHWSIGFNHISLFFESPEDAGFAVARKLEEQINANKGAESVSVSIHVLDGAWWDLAKTRSRYYLRRQRLDIYEDVCSSHEKHNDRASRDAIVADVAVLEAHAMGMDWFGFVNIHECVYVPRNQDASARRYLCSKDRSVESVRLWHFEAVPESLVCKDWMRDCTLFFVSRHYCDGFTPPREYDALLRAREGTEFQPEPVSKDTKWWTDIVVQLSARRRAVFDQLGLGTPEVPSVLPIGILADDDADALAPALCAAPTASTTFVRLDRHFKPPLPHGLHGYLDDSGRMLKECYQGNEQADAVILSYPNASRAYWRERGLRSASSRLRPRVPQPWAADLVSGQVLREGDDKEQDLFYRTFVMQNEHGELPVLAEHGLLRRIDGIKEILERSDNPKEPEEELPGRQKLCNDTGVFFGRV